MTARAIMVFGTSSHVGKSLLTAALFRAGRSSRRAFQNHRTYHWTPRLPWRVWRLDGRRHCKLKPHASRPRST